MLFLFVKIAALFAFGFFSLSQANNTSAIIALLALVCIFILQLLLERIFMKKNLSALLILLSGAICIHLESSGIFPLLTVLTFEFLALHTADLILYEVLSVVSLLEYLILAPGVPEGIIALILLLLASYACYLTDRIGYYRNLTAVQKEQLLKLSQKLTDNKQLIKTLKYTAALEERNRFAARMHDKIGHGISGSLLMLEAALLNFKSHPQKAEEGIRKAVENLRAGVDDIRMSLREERPIQSVLGINEVTVLLNEFESNHSVCTKLSLNAKAENISLLQWQCIYENLGEALTNVAKHSRASLFTIEISLANKLLKVVYRDNGVCSPDFKKGLGLETIEERTIKSQGRCFFEGGPGGFVITTVFTVERRNV